MKTTRDRQRYVPSMKDFNRILEIADTFSIIVYGDKPEEFDCDINTARFSWLSDKQRYTYLTTRYVKDFEENGGVRYELAKEKYVCTWIFDKSQQIQATVTPVRVQNEFNSIYAPYNVVRDMPILQKTEGKTWPYSAVPLLGVNRAFVDEDRKGYFPQIYVYDLNSAYAWALHDEIPDTYDMRMYSTVEDGEIGFNLLPGLPMVHNGEADVVFPLMPSPYKKKLEELYKIKRTAPKGSVEKANAKFKLVCAVGLFQLRNPFLRAFVVNRCNEYIQSIVARHKDHVVMWNTDAVYSKTPLPLPMGEELGQFKLEYVGRFAVNGMNYQKIDTGETTYRGICKDTIPRNFNILTDKPDKKAPHRIRYDATKKRMTYK